MGETLVKSQILQLQCLVDELTKVTPDEKVIKDLMTRLNLKYDIDPIQRITYVLESMNKLVASNKEKKVEYDL